MPNIQAVSSATELLEALNTHAKAIEISGVISDLSSFTLAPGQAIYGKDSEAKLSFKPGQPGLILAPGCTLRNLHLMTDLTQVAVGLLDDGSDLGKIIVQNITTTGRFHLEAQGAMSGDLHLENIHVKAADARMAAHRPAGFGVEVLLGGLSIYNSSRNPQSAWNLSAFNLSCGSAETPIQGSGIFIFGGDHITAGSDPLTAPGPNTKGGQVYLNALTTGPVFTNGGIPAGIGNLITGGVFIGSGTVAENVTNEAEVTTWGPNDMVLDNWGSAKNWLAKAKIISHGASGIGFVNFGKLDLLTVRADIVTHGLGARGFNLYDGNLGTAKFQSIITHGDGAIGIQISKPFGRIEVEGDVATHGGTGDSLVRGKVVRLKAHALSLKPGAKGQAILIGGKASTADSDIEPLDLSAAGNSIETLEISGK